MTLRGFAKKIYWDTPAPGFIYFVQMDSIGPIKIGYTTDMEKRMKHLQTANPYKLHTLLLIEGDPEFERDIHSGFDEIRIRGEWFLAHPFLLEQIKLIKAAASS